MIQQAPHAVFVLNAQATAACSLGIAPHPGRAGPGTARAAGIFGLVALLVAGCADQGALRTIPRTLNGTTELTPFVQPFAYEAYVRGELALAQGAFSEAARQFERSSEAPQKDPYVLARLAYAQARAGKGEAAAKTLEQALLLDPCAEQVWLTRAELAERAGDLHEALLAYSRAGDCAPKSSRGPIGKARALGNAGKPSEALEVLGQFAGPDTALTARVAFAAALQGTDPAVLAHAFETWVAYEAPDIDSVVQAATWALKKGLPGLSLRLRQHHPGPFPIALEAQILRGNGRREELLQLLEQVPASDLGGARSTAELALFAGNFERAELEATTALSTSHADDLRALRALARILLGQREGALADLRAIVDPEAKQRAVIEVLARDGSPALALELSTM